MTEDDVASTCCVDCLMFIANGETPPNMTEEETAAWVAEIDRRTEGFHVAPACEEGCEGWFSMSPCGICGSSLGGDRHPVILTPIPIDLSALTDDGDTVDLPDGRRITLRVEPDPDASINDDDVNGRVEWSRRDRDTGRSVRPSDMDGAARILTRDGHADLWWQPWEGCADPAADEPRIRELAEYGFKQVGLILSEQVADSRGGTHRVDVDTEWIGGCDDVYPELIADLWSELSARSGTER